MSTQPEQKRIDAAIGALSLADVDRHNEAIKEGYKDEACPKCGAIFLAHHHLVNCTNAPNNCPMVGSGSKSIIERIFGDDVATNSEPVVDSQEGEARP